MNQLIKITEQNGNKTVSARELYNFLGVKTRFDKWILRMFEYGFTQNIDYQCLTKNVQMPNGGFKQTLDDYALTLDTAKEIAMLQRSDKGKQARRYFIEVEKRAKQPLSPLDLMEYSIKMLKQQDAKITEFDNRILQLEAKTTTRPETFTIAGYATLQKIKMPLKLASSLGRKASKLCKDLGITPDEIPDPRFGIVKSYPTEVLEEIFENSLV